MIATLPPHLTITPRGAFEVSLRLPGSKSLTNRALLLGALAEGTTELTGVLFSDDSRVMLDALQRLGFGLAIDEPARRVVVEGAGGRIPADRADLFLGNAGTAFRFLTAACCLGRGTYRLDGVPRMRQRPIGELVEALARFGGTVHYEGTSGYPPLRIDAAGLRHATAEMSATLSSQYISAVLQVGPYADGGVTVAFDGPVTSRPYVEMTLALMRRFGARCDVDERFTRIDIAPGAYAGRRYDVEPDASNASYFLAAAALLPGSSCTVEALGTDSLQGDVAFVDVLAEMGATVEKHAGRIAVSSAPGSRLRGVNVNCNAIPDAAMTLATIAVYADGPTTIRDVGNWRVKETDRMEAMRVELTKLGTKVTVEGDDLTIEPPPGNRPRHAAIDTYDDHRMAMSFAILGLHPDSPGVTINDPRCVEKTFPDFFEYLDRLRP